MHNTTPTYQQQLTAWAAGTGIHDDGTETEGVMSRGPIRLLGKGDSLPGNS